MCQALPKHLDIFKSFLEKIHSLPTESWERIASKCRSRHVDSKVLFLKHGQIEHYMRFLIEGVTKATFYSEYDSYIYGFRQKGDLLSDPVSFFERKPTAFTIETLTPCIWLEISFEDLDELIKTDDTIQLIVSKSSNAYLEEKFKEQDYFRSYSAQERYDIFLRNFPEIFKYASLGDIASYLGITQQSLSRIRKAK